jgi:RimJ/RimL family protein N-acetyltransferase
MTATFSATTTNHKNNLCERVTSQLAMWKEQPSQYEIKLDFPGYPCTLRPLGAWCLEQPEIVKHIADWRRKNQIAFPAIFNVTYAGTLAWFNKRVIEDSERVLFGVFDSHNCMVAHAGYATFNWETGDGEVDNIMRGDDSAPKGLMTAVVSKLVSHAYANLGLNSVSLRVFGDNWRAIKMYKQCGFQPVESIPLTCVFNESGLSWQQLDSYHTSQTFRIFLRMKHEQH